MADQQGPDRDPAPQSESRGRAFSPHAIHLMRTAQLGGLAQSRMADHKASILLGATFLVFSLSITRALTGDVPIALSVLAAFSFASSLSAVMAVLPSVSQPKEKAGARTNLLFFGHFAARDEDEWTAELLDTLETDETVFRAIAHDVYQNGQVLRHKKFRYLSLAYRLFIAGLVTTLLVFAAEMLRAG